MNEGITPRRLADMLMMRVYTPFSAVAAVDESGRVLSLCQFDTLFAGESMTFDEAGAQVWLLTNHPDGRRSLTREDEANVRRLLARRRDARVFIAGEDIGCVEVEIAREA